MSRCTKLEALPSGINLKSLDRLDLGGCLRLKKFPDISSNMSRLDLSPTMIEEFPYILHLENLKTLTMKEIKSRKLWEGPQPLTCLTTLDLSGSEKLQEVPDLSLAINMEWMNLGGCSSLVELPSSSIQNLKKLAYLSMEDCTNLEVLPTDVNLESLDCLNFGGCSRLKMFPEISNTMYLLILNRPAIEEVPRWIDTFNRLRCLRPLWPINVLSRIHETTTLHSRDRARARAAAAPAPVEKADDDEEAKEEGYDENQKFDDLERNDTGLFANDVYDEDDKEADAIWESIDQMMDSSRHHGRKLR
ncbi:hypothetical protein Bca52824_002603 [Brassica carinata]|uniref:PRP1 splicing factor N-terminal domain-containing protein n=1 Tax=Brassica carinata TaxID=52824 RepID=A0A8X7WNN0_BRACI|nr:hypothetical protein Bca52824_002603 [Brassica carinata]